MSCTVIAIFSHCPKSTLNISRAKLIQSVTSFDVDTLNRCTRNLAPYYQIFTVDNRTTTTKFNLFDEVHQMNWQLTQNVSLKLNIAKEFEEDLFSSIKPKPTSGTEETNRGRQTLTNVGSEEMPDITSDEEDKIAVAVMKNKESPAEAIK